jgi:phosphatidylinositol alpha-mannosyltransferase
MVSPYSWDFPGGVNRHVEQLSAHLRGRGHEVTVIAPGGRDGDGFFSVGGSIRISANQSVANISFGLRVAARIRKLLRETPLDVLHLHEPLIPSASILALFFSRCANLATFHAA